MEEAGIFQLYDLSYSDLLLLSSPHHHHEPSPSQPELRRLDSARAKIMEALGPTGPGLMAVSGVPDSADLLRHLSLARTLALLDPDRRKRILKEQKLGTDVPLKDPVRKVSSFAMKLRYERDSTAESNHEFVEPVDDGEYKNLGRNLENLGFAMVEIGLRIARVCDAAIGAGHELERSLLESSAAKGRLIHYHSGLDRRFLLKRGPSKIGTKSKCEQRNRENSAETGFDLWQEWHYDYGIFTVLTAPLFLSQQVIVEECGYPDGRTFLQVFDQRKKGIFDVKASPGSFIVQVGESAEVISEGKLRATLHSVAGPGKSENLSRETFVVFLQPAWDRVLRVTHGTVECSGSVDGFGERGEEERSAERIRKAVPPLASRLKDRMTFADFSRETTRQYYGGKGLQSNR